MSKSLKRHLSLIVTVSLWASPFVAIAATDQNLEKLIAKIAGYLNNALELLMGFAVVAFVWYVIKYFILSSDEKNRGEAAQYVMWSLIGFFVILSVWGLVNILLATFNLGGSSPGALTNMSNIFPQ